MVNMPTKFFKNKVLFEIAFVILLGLTPILWFTPPGYLITGADVGYPTNPSKRLIDRTYVWNPVFQAGSDKSVDTSTMPFTAIQSVFYVLSGDLVTSEMLTFIFWFTMVGVSMFLLMWQVFPELRVARSVAVSFYMFNFYQFYNWEIARIGEISGTIALPILLGIFVRCSRRRKFGLLDVFITAAICLLTAGVGLQPPIFILIFATLFLFLIVNSGLKLRNFVSDLKTFIFMVLIFLLVGAFWILPEINFVLTQNLTSTSRAIEVFDPIPLLEWTSRRSTLLSVIRSFPRPVSLEWWGGEPYFPGLQPYVTDPFLIALSFLPPILAFAALLLNRKKIVAFFGLIAILGMWFSKGVHPPLGEIYKWIYLNVPGFWVYRAPWEKIALITVLAYAVMIGLTAQKIYEHSASVKRELPKPNFFKLDYRKMLGITFVGIIIVANITLNQSLLIGRCFPRPEERKSYPPMHVKIPSYVFDAASWLNSIPHEFKIVTLPDDRVSVYDWGYAAPGDIIAVTELIEKGVVNRNYLEGTAPPRPFDELYRVYVKKLYSGQCSEAAAILGLLNVRYALQRNDIRYNFYGDTDSPDFIKQKLVNNSLICFDRSFEKWDFYELTDYFPRIYCGKNVLVADKIEDTLPLLVASGFSTQPIVYSADINSNRTNEILDLSGLNIIRIIHESKLSLLDALPEKLVIMPSTDPVLRNPALVSTQINDFWRVIVSGDSILNLSQAVEDPTINDDVASIHMNISKGHAGEICHTFQRIQSWDSRKALSFYWFGLGSGKTIRFVAQTNGWSDFFYFDFEDTTVGWDNKVLRLDEFSAYGKPTWSHIQELKITFQTHLSPWQGTYKIGNLYLGWPDTAYLFHVPNAGNYFVVLTSASKDVLQSSRLVIDGNLKSPARTESDERGVSSAYFELLNLTSQSYTVRVDGVNSSDISFFVINCPDIGDFFVEEDDVPLVSYEKIDRCKYRVTVNASEPFFLVLNENYDPHWKAFIGDIPWYTAVISNAIPEERHFLVNGYANGWFIDKTGRFEITLFYETQALFLIGGIISIAPVMPILGVLLWRWENSHRLRLRFKHIRRNKRDGSR